MISCTAASRTALIVDDAEAGAIDPMFRGRA